MTQEQLTKTANSDDTQDMLLARHGGIIRCHAFAPGTVLFRKGDKRHCAFLIDNGEVTILGNDDGGEDKLLCTLNEGDIFGEMALIDDEPRSATAIVSADAEIFVIPRSALQDRVKGLDPIIGLLISILIEHYRTSRIHLPESIKHDRVGDLVQKISRHENLPEEMLRLHNSKEQREKVLREMKLEQELRVAIDNDQFIPVLQPILRLPERRIAGFEALIRWHHPDKGIVPPNDFIPVAERTGLVQKLDQLMLEKACAILPDLQKKAGDKVPNLFISVNLSGINFENTNVINTVRSTLVRSDIDPAHIKLEITESALIAEPAQAEKVLQGLKAIGVTVALDDFGTGYSSLGYLHRFPIDDLKIDRSFVAQMATSSKSVDIVRAIVGLARNFKLNIVAEGIETENDVIAINSLGCDMGQGYLFSRPLPVAEAAAFIEKNLSK